MIRGYVPRENEHRGAHFRGWCTHSRANLCAGARLRGGNEYAVTPAACPSTFIMQAYGLLQFVLPSLSKVFSKDLFLHSPAFY